MQWLHLSSLSLCLLLPSAPFLLCVPYRNFPTFISGVLPFVRGRRTDDVSEAEEEGAPAPSRSLPVIALSSFFPSPPCALAPLRDRNNEMTRCLHLAVKENRRQIGEERTRRGGGIRKEENETFINEGEKRERTLTRWCKEHFGAITAILP